jgi:hypothetical protein
MKTNKIIYWIATGVASALFFLSAFMYLSKNPDLMKNFEALGFPAYFVTILGVAKLLGAIAIINPWSPRLKEWAYAGYAFVLIGATWTHFATHTPFAMPLVILGVVGVSYYFYSRIYTTVKA